jgi:chorismate-pyruvate lyase
MLTGAYSLEGNAMHIGCDIDHLQPALRLLLISDGTLTDMLQAVCREGINVRVLAQSVQPAVRRIDALDLGPGELWMSRRVVLYGARTGTNYVYADSCIAFDRLDVRLRHGLMKSDTPIGRLWRENRVELFKEVISVSNQPSGHAAEHFGTRADAPLIVRTCRVSSGSRPAMLITEHFSPALAAGIAFQNMGSPRHAECLGFVEPALRE